MEGYKNVLILGEINGEQISALTTQLLQIGKKLAEDLQQELQVIFLGGQSQAGAAEAYGYGADKVYMAVDEQLTNYMTDSYLQILEQAANELKPAIILFGQNQTGLDVAPRLAFRLKAGVTLDCVDLSIDAETGLLEQVKPVFGGKAHGHFLSEIGGPQIATVREGTFDPAEFEASRTGEIVDFEATLDASRIRTRFIRKEKDASQELALKLAGANIVVSGGPRVEKAGRCGFNQGDGRAIKRGCSRDPAGHRPGLVAEFLTGRPDREKSKPAGIHGGWDIGCTSTHGRLFKIKNHRGHQHR